MHYAMLLVTDQIPRDRINCRPTHEKVVEGAMSPGYEDWWDWWQIGPESRWSDFFGRHPEKLSIPMKELTQEHIDGAYWVLIPEWRARPFGGDDYLPWKKEPMTTAEKPALEWLKTNFPRHRVVIVDHHN